MSTKQLSSVKDFFDEGETFDFIIVGGGTAGLTVAARLAENPDIRVGVIEAGAAHLDDSMILTPGFFPQLIGNPDYDWNFKTVPQSGTNNQIKSFPRGKVLGGSSAINYMMYTRGQKEEYDDWTKLGNDGWDWDNLLPYFLKAERFQKPPRDIYPNVSYDDGFHGFDGPIHTSFGTFRLPIEDVFHAASNELGTGFNVIKDSWGGGHLGSHSGLSTVDTSDNKGTRSYAVTGYYLPNKHRRNLKILTQALVSKIILEKSGQTVKAIGIQFLVSGQTHTAIAKRETILCAGVVNTPQLLELSGMGKADVLSSAGVEVVIENNFVGENLQDHLMTVVVYELVEDEISFDSLQIPEVAEDCFKQYADRKGPLASGQTIMNFQSFAHFASSNANAEVHKIIGTVPDSDVTFYTAQRNILAERLRDKSSATLNFTLIPATSAPDRFDDQKAFLKPPSPGNIQISCGISLMFPFSRGSIHISSADPRVQPQIDPRYLESPADTKILAEGLRLADNIFRTSPLSHKIKHRVSPSQNIDLSDSYARETYMRQHCGTQYHPIGTAAMGQVVDTKLKVIGVQSLRVVDASVMPMHISGNISATVYALAERAADIIKKDWHLRAQ